jgi:mannose-6-phosphate isomerase-like protein (cupin superfamily)
MSKVNRPWGWYENLYDDMGYKVKRLFVEKEQKISLQYHECRSEYWVVVQGFGKVELNGTVKDVTVGDYIFISLRDVHRIYGGTCGIMIVEVQIGSSCIEEDIIRLEDDYGRV